MKPNTLLFLILLLLTITCTERVWNNPFDKNTNLNSNEWMPQNFKAVVDGKNVMLLWESGTSAKVSFKIDRSLNNGTWETAFTSLAAGINNYTDTTADVLSSTCKYQIYAIAGVNESAKSNVSVQKVDDRSWAPGNLTIKTENGNVILRWKDVSQYEEKYLIDRCINNSIWEIAIATLNAGATTYSDATTDVFANDYEYRVYAVVGTNESAKIEIKIRKVINSIEMVLIDGGTIQMGSPTNELDGNSDETQHLVTLNSFYMCKYEVTQKQWFDIMGTKPSYFINCDNCPVENVSWEDIQIFLTKINEKYSGYYYRLPTEAEWEYAARAGTYTQFNTGDCLASTQANYDGNYPYQACSKGIYQDKTIAVGSYAPNAFGLYDMHGNVYEWCSDWYGAYSTDAQTNPTGPTSGTNRVLRGGGWFSEARYCRSAARFGGSPNNRRSIYGFRLVLSVSIDY